MSDFERLWAQFGGIPSSYGAKPKDREKSIRHFIDDISEQYSIESPRAEVLIIQNWREIVGAANAHRCKPNKLTRDGTLIISTHNSTLRMELQFQRSQILKNLWRFVGKDTVRNITVR